MRAGKGVPDWINLICGALLFVSPWVLAFSGDMTPATTAWVGGIVIAVMGVAALAQFAEWEDWVALGRRRLDDHRALGPGLRRDDLCGLDVRRAWVDRGGRLGLGNLDRSSFRPLDEVIRSVKRATRSTSTPCFPMARRSRRARSPVRRSRPAASDPSGSERAFNDARGLIEPAGDGRSVWRLSATQRCSMPRRSF